MNHLNLFSSSFKGKKILVTGHTGFKGAWLALWLTQLGAKVIGYALPPSTEPNFFDQSELSKYMISIEGDIKDIKHLQKVISEYQPEIVFHLAAQPLVHYSFLEPLATIETNIMGTANVLEIIRQNGSSVKVCQVITSDKCYENNELSIPFVETDPMGGSDIYSASKGCAELLISAYRKSFFQKEKILQGGISLSSVRAGNVIGGGDLNPDRIVPDCIRHLTKNEAIKVRNPKAVRPWQYMLDAIAGYLSLASFQLTGSPVYADAWNFGPTTEAVIPVAALADKIIHHWGSGSWVTTQNYELIHEAQFLSLDSTKANTALEWSSVYTTDEAIAQTIQWYRDTQQLDQKQIHEYSVSQIKQYVEATKNKRRLWTIQEKALR